MALSIRLMALPSFSQSEQKRRRAVSLLERYATDENSSVRNSAAEGLRQAAREATERGEPVGVFVDALCRGMIGEGTSSVRERYERGLTDILKAKPAAASQVEFAFWDAAGWLMGRGDEKELPGDMETMAKLFAAISQAYVKTSCSSSVISELRETMTDMGQDPSISLRMKMMCSRALPLMPC